MNKLVERKMFKFCLDGDNLDKAIRKSLFDKETSDRVVSSFRYYNYYNNNYDYYYYLPDCFE